jgi:hypothetical protein
LEGVWEPVGLNLQWRLSKYYPGNHFGILEIRQVGFIFSATHFQARIMMEVLLPTSICGR